MLSKKLKSQHENFVLESNQDVPITDARVTFTSLQNVKGYDDMSTFNKQMNPCKYFDYLQFSPLCTAFRQTRKSEGPVGHLKDKLILRDPDFMKYLSDSKVRPRLAMTSLNQKSNIEMRPAKFRIDNNMIDYKTFTNSITQSKPKELKLDFAPHKFLDSIKSVSELNNMINPGNFDLDKDDEFNRLQNMMNKPDDTKMTDQQLDGKIKTNEIKKK